MPEDLPPTRPVGEREPGVGQVTFLDHALWRQLADATTAEAFCTSWLALQARMIGGVSSGVVVLRRTDTETMAPVASWPSGARDHRRLTEVIERALRERKGVVIRDEPGAAGGESRLHLAYPVWGEEGAEGVAALQISPRPQEQLQSAMRQLQWGMAWLQNWVLRRAAAPETQARERLKTALELTAVALEEERFRSAATALVTELASRLNCDRVSLGFVKGRQVKVHALSHSAQFGKQMNLIRAIGMAMAESTDQQAVLVWPETDQASQQVLQAHEQLARTQGDGAVCTVPFVRSDGSAFGALTLERAVAEPFARHEVALSDAVASVVGPILDEKRRNDRWLVVKAADSLWSQVRKLVGPRHAVRKIVAVALVGLVLFFAFAKGQYRVTAKTILEGEVRRSVVAPFRGFIAAAPARAGDVVEEGQALCALDERDLRLQYSRWSSEREQYLLEHRRAMADGDVAAMKVLTKKMNQAEAQLALLDEQLERAEIVAPFAGVVVSGDLSQSLGAPVEAGQVLFEVTPLDAYRVMLQVDEHDVRDVRVDQPGQLVLTALPERRLGFTVSKITPVALAEEGSNYFEVEARLDQISEDLRPGMEGFGKIDIDRRRLIWIWTHDLIDWVRLKIWSWWP